MFSHPHRADEAAMTDVINSRTSSVAQRPRSSQTSVTTRRDSENVDRLSDDGLNRSVRSTEQIEYEIEIPTSYRLSTNSAVSFMPGYL